jgi:hypothetical protein
MGKKGALTDNFVGISYRSSHYPVKGVDKFMIDEMKIIDYS